MDGLLNAKRTSDATRIIFEARSGSQRDRDRFGSVTVALWDGTCSCDQIMISRCLPVVEYTIHHRRDRVSNVTRGMSLMDGRVATGACPEHATSHPLRVCNRLMEHNMKLWIGEPNGKESNIPGPKGERAVADVP